MRHYLALKLDPIPLLGAVTMWTKKRAWNFQNMDISSAKMSDGFFLMLLVARLLLQIGTIRQFYKDNFDNKIQICNSLFTLMLTATGRDDCFLELIFEKFGAVLVGPEIFNLRECLTANSASPTPP